MGWGATAHMWKAEDNLQDSVLSYHVDPGIKLRWSGLMGGAFPTEPSCGHKAMSLLNEGLS